MACFLILSIISLFIKTFKVLKSLTVPIFPSVVYRLCPFNYRLVSGGCYGGAGLWSGCVPAGRWSLKCQAVPSGTTGWCRKCLITVLASWQGLRTQQHGLKQRPRAPGCAQSSRAPGAGRLLLSNCSMEPSEGAALLSASRMVPVATPLPVPGALVPELEFSPCPTDPEPKQSGPVLSSMWAGMVWGLCLAFGGSCRPPPMKEKADFTF